MKKMKQNKTKQTKNKKPKTKNKNEHEFVGGICGAEVGNRCSSHYA
jgi:hypothetical protein